MARFVAANIIYLNVFKEWWKYIWKWQADSPTIPTKKSLGYTNESLSQRNSLPSVSSLMRMSFTLHWSFSFPAFDTFHLFSKIPPISLRPFVSCMQTELLYSLEFFRQFSLSLSISFKISATTNFNSLLSFQFYLRNSFILAYLHVDIYKNTHLLTNHFSVFPRHILFSTPAIFYLELFNLPRQTFHSSNSWSNDLEPTSSRVFTICSSGGSELPLLRHRASFLLAAAGTFISLISKYSQPGLEICGVHVLLLPRLFVYHPNWVIKLAFLNLGCLNHFKS